MAETLARLERMVKSITFPPADVDGLVTSLLAIARDERHLVVYHTETVWGFHFGELGRYFPSEKRPYIGVFRAAIARLYVRARESGQVTGSLYGYSGHLDEDDEKRVFILAYNQPPFPQIWLRTEILPAIPACDWGVR